ncbi:MAG: hypothetical protein ACJ0QY_06175 [Porticoccaceae bacterium]|jgi:hypothetical protein
MFKKLLICLMIAGLGECTLLSIPLAVVDTAAGIVKLPITAVDSVIDAINEDEDEE